MNGKGLIRKVSIRIVTSLAFRHPYRRLAMRYDVELDACNIDRGAVWDGSSGCVQLV